MSDEDYDQILLEEIARLSSERDEAIAICAKGEEVWIHYCTSLRERAERAEAERDAARAEWAQARGELDAANLGKQLLELRIDQFRERWEKAETERAEARAEADRLRGDLDRTEIDLAGTRRSHEAAMHAADRLRERAERAEAERDEARESHAHNLAECDRLIAERDAARAELAKGDRVTAQLVERLILDKARLHERAEKLARLACVLVAREKWLDSWDETAVRQDLDWFDGSAAAADQMPRVMRLAGLDAAPAPQEGDTLEKSS